MKIAKRITLLFAVSFVIQTAQAQVSGPDSLIHQLFTTLKTKNEQAYVALYPNASQFGKMMRVMMEQMLNSEEMKQMMAMDEKSKNMNLDSLINAEIEKLNNPEVFDGMKKGFAVNFQKIIEKGESKGVKWNEAMLTSFTVDSTAADSEDLQMFKGSGVKTIKGIIDFRVGDSAYQMSYDKIVYLPAERGWFGGEFPQLARKGESLQPDAETYITDSMVMPVDTAMYQPPKTKVKSKAKTKTPATKTKAKTKTPARKPAAKS